jgi:hypothetical protein
LASLELIWIFQTLLAGWKMAKDFGSSEGWVNAEEIFLRGKQTAEHEYKHFENAFLCLFGLKMLGSGKLQVLEQ